MLKAMFNEIKARLGDQYALFEEFNPQIFCNEEILAKYRNIGVLYINNGNLGTLPDSAIMNITYTLELFMRIDDTFITSDLVTKDLVNLATGTTGVIMSDGAKTQFVLDTGLPTSDGNIVKGLGPCDYIRYELPIAVTFVNNVELAKTDDVVITINGIAHPLKSVLSVVEVPQTQVETNTFLNTVGDYPAMQNESSVVAFAWGLQVVKLYRPSEDLMIRQAILDSPTVPVTVTYKGKTRRVIFHDCSFANELGQAVVMTINVSTAMRTV